MNLPPQSILSWVGTVKKSGELPYEREKGSCSGCAITVSVPNLLIYSGSPGERDVEQTNV
jgi:hypothetical protein